MPPAQQHPIPPPCSSLFSALASIPSATAARFLGTDALQVDYSVSHQSKLNASQSIHLRHPPSADIVYPLQFLDPQIQHQSVSPTGTKVAIFRAINEPPSASAKAQLKLRIDIWDNSINALHASYDLTSAHQAFVINSTFGYPSWNPSESCLAYVAETIIPESRSWLERNRYRPDFGEQLTEIRSPAIFVLTVDPVPIQILDPSHPARIIQLTPDPSDSNDSSTLVFCQPAFGRQPSPQKSNDHQVFCTGLACLPDHRRLGLIYCQNRPSSIFELKFKVPSIKEDLSEEKPIKASHPIQLTRNRISTPDRSARSPYVIDENRVVYLSNPVGGPHASCASLHLYNCRSSQHSVLVGPVDEPSIPKSPKLNPFPGLYVDQLQGQAQLTDPSDPKKTIIVMTSISQSYKRPVTVELDTGVPSVHYPPNDCSATLLATDGHLNALFAVSKTNLPTQIWIATLSRTGGFLSFSWRMITQSKPPAEISAKLSSVESRVIRVPVAGMGPTEIVITSPTRKILGMTKSSLIIAPHGGPHSTSVNEYSPTTASMALLGFSTAYINYPGSLGFGQKWVTELPKNLGVTDVQSCKLATEYLTTLDFIKELQVDNRIFVNGGSHGGFITAHLTSRYPDMFRAACMRNPVVDLVGTASGGSDIPDWSYAEVNLSFPNLDPTECKSQTQTKDAKVSVNEIDYQTLRDRSPIKLIEDVKTPTLILLGSQDRRVSNQQGLAWYHGIKNSTKNIRTELVLFDKDSHPLSSISAQLHSFLAWLEFIFPYSHLNRTR